MTQTRGITPILSANEKVTLKNQLVPGSFNPFAESSSLKAPRRRKVAKPGMKTRRKKSRAHRAKGES